MSFDISRFSSATRELDFEDEVFMGQDPRTDPEEEPHDPERTGDDEPIDDDDRDGTDEDLDEE